MREPSTDTVNSRYVESQRKQKEDRGIEKFEIFNCIENKKSNNLKYFIYLRSNRQSYFSYFGY